MLRRCLSWPLHLTVASLDQTSGGRVLEIMQQTDTCYLRAWSATGVSSARERISTAAAWIRKQQLEGLGFRVVITNARGEAMPERGPQWSDRPPPVVVPQ